MAQEDSKKQTSFINIPQLVKAYLYNWKWVIASVIMFLGLGVIVYLKQVRNCEVQAQVLISDEGSSKTSSIGELASMFGGGSSFGANRSIEDEMVVIKSHSLLKETAQELGLNESYFVQKSLLRRVSVYYNPPVKLIYDKSIADTLGAMLRFDVKVDADGLTKIKVRGLKNKVIYETSEATLPFNVETLYGKFTLVPGSTFIEGKSLDETILLCSYDAAALALNKLISVELSAKKTDIMALSYITSDAVFGKSVLNTLVNNYNELTIRQKQAFHVKTLEFLEDRIRILSAEVDSTQSQVEAFMGRRDLVNPEAQAGIYITRTSEQEIELIKAESEYELLNMAIEFLSNEANNTSMLPIMPSTASLTPLIEGYNQLILSRLELESSAKGDNIALKAMNTRINAVRDNLLAALNKQSESANFEISEMRRQYARSKGQLETMPGIEREYTNILREQTLKEQLYVYLLRQREETEMAIAGAHPRGVIIDQAFVTDQILGMSPKVVMGLFFLIGLIVPGLFILGKWKLSKRISLADQAIELSGNKDFIARLSIDLLSEPVVVREPASDMAKGIRLLRSNTVSLSDVLPVTTIIGTTADNHSSRVALNYAAAMALTGRRAILIEANPFRHMIAEMLQVSNPAELSFTNVDGDCKPATVSLGDKNTIDYIQCRLDEHFGDDLIESVGFETLVRKFAGIYDVVVISAPSIASYYPAVERLNRLSGLTLVTVQINKSTKSALTRVSLLETPQSGLYLVEVTCAGK